MIREREAQTTIDNAIRIARKTHVEGETLTPTDIGIDDITDIQEAIDVWRTADHMLKAIRQVKTAAGAQLASLLGEGGAAMVGDTVIRYEQGRKERCIDPDGLAAYATNELFERRVRIADIVTPDKMKVSWMSDAVRDTFHEWIDDDGPSLTEKPRGKSPLFLQGLKDGDVIIKEERHE